MQLTDWLVVVFIIAIVVVMLDGVRRKVQERRNRVVLKIDRNLPREDFDEDLLARAELPNGGARTLPRAGQPSATLRNLKTSRKSARPLQATESSRGDSHGTVPVLMDAVELEEEHIEHTNVFADSGAGTSFEADDFKEESHVFRQEPTASGADDWDADDIDDDDWSNAADDREEDEDDEDAEDFEEDYEEVAPMLREEPVARSRQASGLETRYQGTDDDYEGDEELAEDEFDDDEFEDELVIPAELDDDEDEEDDDDDLDDDFDDEDEEDELDEDEELDELGGYPEDDWGIEEEQDLLVDDYENEPVLLQDAYNKAASHFSRSSQQPRIEPGFGDGDAFDEEALDEDFSDALTDETEAGHSSTLESMQPLPGTRRIVPESVPAERSASSPAQAAAAVPAPLAHVEGIPEKPQPQRPDQSELFRDESRMKTAPGRQAAAKPPAAPEPEPVDPGPQEVIIINVMARPGRMLKGSELLPVLQQQGLRLGDMSIFHRHADAQGNGPVVFSMANMVKPGTFDLGTMETFATPGVSLFLQMPNRIGNMAAFDMMLGTATALRNALDAELKDENRSVFTRQTVEHSRQRVSDFELALLSYK